MRQALHIFKKDARHLWPEIGLVLVVTAFAQYAGNQRLVGIFTPSRLLLLAWWFLVGRAIQSDALPGDKQFWRTRPYSRASLCAAKALFLATFLLAPMAISQIVVLEAHGFAARDFWPGLIFEQLLLFAVFGIPVAALATLTAEIKAYVVAMLLAFVAAAAMFSRLPDSWGILDWLQDATLMGFLCVSALVLISWQYARLKTWATRAGAVVALALAGAILHIPAWVGWSVAPRLSSNWWAASWVKVTLDGSAPKTEARSLLSGLNYVEADLPLRFIGLPRGVTPRADEIRVDNFPMHAEWIVDEQGSPHQRVFMDAVAFEGLKNSAIDIDAFAVVTLTRNRHLTRVSAASGRAVLPDGIVCEGRPMRCGAPFRPPELMTFFGAKAPAGWVSYSPFPAEIALDPIIDSGRLNPMDDLTVATEEPVAHFLVRFTLQGVRLADYELRPNESQSQ